MIELIAAVIAGGVSSIAGVLSYKATSMKINAEMRTFEKSKKEEYKKSIFLKRIEVYPKAWNILGELSSINLKRDYSTVKSTCEDVMLSLHNWYNLHGGLLLSKKTRDRYFTLRSCCLKLRTVKDDKETAKLINKIWHSKMDFRQGLRIDVNLEIEYTTQESWRDLYD